METTKLAEIIVKSLEDSTCDLDSIETVKDLLDKHYPKPEHSKPDDKGTQYILRRAGTMEMDTIGVYNTKKEVFDRIVDWAGELEDYDGNIIANYDDLINSDICLWDYCEMEIDVIHE
jgi:hypothetical protein